MTLEEKKKLRKSKLNEVAKIKDKGKFASDEERKLRDTLEGEIYVLTKQIKFENNCKRLIELLNSFKLKSAIKKDNNRLYILLLDKYDRWIMNTIYKLELGCLYGETIDSETYISIPLSTIDSDKLLYQYIFSNNILSNGYLSKDTIYTQINEVNQFKHRKEVKSTLDINDLKLIFMKTKQEDLELFLDKAKKLGYQSKEDAIENINHIELQLFDKNIIAQFNEDVLLGENLDIPAYKELSALKRIVEQCKEYNSYMELLKIKQ